MSESFRMRIGSCSERMSADFAFAILPHLQSFSGQQLTPIQITPEKHLNGYPFSDVRSWDWPLSIERLRELARNGTNMLILSEQFLEWETTAEAINDDLERFEDELAALGIAVILVEAFSKRQQAEMLKMFSSVYKWHDASVDFPISVGTRSKGDQPSWIGSERESESTTPLHTLTVGLQETILTPEAMRSSIAIVVHILVRGTR